MSLFYVSGMQYIFNNHMWRRFFLLGHYVNLLHYVEDPHIKKKNFKVVSYHDLVTSLGAIHAIQPVGSGWCHCWSMKKNFKAVSYRNLVTLLGAVHAIQLVGSGWCHGWSMRFMWNLTRFSAWRSIIINFFNMLKTTLFHETNISRRTWGISLSFVC